MITKEELLNDPYGACKDYHWDTDTPEEVERLFFQAAHRIDSFSIYGDVKPDAHSVLLDVWDFYTQAEKEQLKQKNHPFWQAVQELGGE